jgi:hypothetical protein
MNRPLRRSSDDGFALVAALVVISVISLLVGVVLQYSYTSEQNTTVTTIVNKTVYAGDGLADDSVRQLATSQYSGIAPYSQSPCFPTTEAINGVTGGAVSCTARTNSGTISSSVINGEPKQAVLALSANASEGTAQAANSTAIVQGDIAAGPSMTQGSGSTVTTLGSVTAGTSCAVSGVVTPLPFCPTAQPGDPANDATYGGSAANAASQWGLPASFPVTNNSAAPACTTPLVTINPGSYNTKSQIQNLLNCPNAVIWFKPGQYYFDFLDASPTSHELIFDGATTGSVLVGGSASGWTPGTTAASAVPFPTAAAPATSACDATQQGVEFIFGGDTRITVNSGKAQLCSYVPTPTTPVDTATSGQHIAIYAPSTSKTVLAGTSNNVPTTAANNSTRAGGASNKAWSNPANGEAVDGALATVKLSSPSQPSQYLDLGGFNTSTVPATATGITATATLTASLGGTTGNLHAYLTWSGGPTGDAGQLVADCPTLNCDGALHAITMTATNLTAAQLATLVIRVYGDNVSNNPIDIAVDGVSVNIPFYLTYNATSGTSSAAPYGPGSASTTAVVKVLGAYPTTVFAVHGTVYAPAGVVDFRSTGVPYTMVDRGVVARHLYLATTQAAGTTQPVISIPLLPRNPRRVLFTVSFGGATELLADVTFTNSAATGGTANGTYAHVAQWSRQR